MKLSPIFLLLPSASAWYLEVHNQIGYVADKLLTPRTKWMVGQILEPEYNGSVGRAASWADTVSRSTAKYSYGWHWISAQDDPPRNCSLLYERDCQPGGCVVQQIVNQTAILSTCLERLKSGSYKADIDCQQALKWTIHFTEDIEQPMHTSGLSLGGNLFEVVFGGQKTNMHQTWDRWILYTGTNKKDGFSDEVIDPYFEQLFDRIQADSFPVSRNEWAMCGFDVSRGIYCPELWARDSNKLVCEYAYGKYVKDSDLLTSGYAKAVFPVVELQLAKAAWRLAGWLNAVTEAHFGKEEIDRYVSKPSDFKLSQSQDFLGNLEL